jgi:hypothetical protein
MSAAEYQNLLLIMTEAHDTREKMAFLNELYMKENANLLGSKHTENSEFV